MQIQNYVLNVNNFFVFTHEFLAVSNIAFMSLNTCILIEKPASELRTSHGIAGIGQIGGHFCLYMVDSLTFKYSSISRFYRGKVFSREARFNGFHYWIDRGRD